MTFLLGGVSVVRPESRGLGIVQIDNDKVKAGFGKVTSKTRLASTTEVCTECRD